MYLIDTELVATGQSAMNPADYLGFSPATVTFQNNENEKPVRLEIKDDTDVEHVEQLLIEIEFVSRPEPDETLCTPLHKATVTIEDDDESESLIN